MVSSEFQSWKSACSKKDLYHSLQYPAIVLLSRFSNLARKILRSFQVKSRSTVIRFQSLTIQTGPLVSAVSALTEPKPQMWWRWACSGAIESCIRSNPLWPATWRELQCETLVRDSNNRTAWWVYSVTSTCYSVLYCLSTWAWLQCSPYQLNVVAQRLFLILSYTWSSNYTEPFVIHHYPEGRGPVSAGTVVWLQLLQC